MTDERKPLWPWIAAPLIGLPVLYVARCNHVLRSASRKCAPERHPGDAGTRDAVRSVKFLSAIARKQNIRKVPMAA